MASVLDLVKHYQHTIEKYSNDEQRVLKCIDKLFNLDVTVQHLQDTGVGRTVNALRKEPGDVGQAARSLVCKWKLMVAAEESDHEPEQNNDTSTHNGHSSGKDSDDYAQSRNKVNQSEKSNTTPRMKERGMKEQKEVNGSYSGTKRKYHSSEEEEHDIKRSKHSSSSEDDYKRKANVKIKKEESESDSNDDSDDSQTDDSDSEMSESSKEDVKVKQEIKSEHSSSHKSSSSKHSQNNHSDHKRESSSSKKPHESDKQTKHHSSHSKDRHSDEKSSSKERSHSSSHKHKSSKEKESSEKKHKSDHKSSDTEKNHKDHKSSSKHSSSEKHKSSSSQKTDSGIDKHKSTSDKHSLSDRHKSTSHLHGSEKEKQKSSSEKEISKHKSKDSHSISSKDKAISSSAEKPKDKDRSSSSKEKSSSHSSEKKHSTSDDSKSHKTHTEKADDKERSSEKKTKHKSSSSAEHKGGKSSSSKPKEEVPKKKVSVNGEDSDDGIDCGSGASFAEALGMISPAKAKKKSMFIKEGSSPNNDLSPASWLAPSAKLAPLPALEISALPEISPNYKPRPPPRPLPHFNDEDALSAVISSKNQRTKVYSGNKVIGKVPSLYELCINVIQENIHALEYTGGVPYDMLKPVVDRATPQQLAVLEHYNPYLMEDTDHLWKAFCEKHFRNKKRQDMEAWREMFMRCQEEQEIRLKSLTANIKLTQEAKKAPIKQTKMAYVDSVAKPPRNIAKKQAQHGTARAAAGSPAARVAALARGPHVLRGSARAQPAPAPTAASFHKPKKAPLMAKALQYMRGRKR